MENTGYQRSLTIMITKEKDGITLIGYPKIYNGQLSFSNFQEITDQELELLSDNDYNTRLNQFKTHVSSLEPDINFNTDIQIGYEPIKINTIECPLPIVTTTTTTQEPEVTTTTTTQARRNINILLSYGGSIGATSGISGEASVCGVMFNVPLYTNQQSINTSGVASQACIVDLSYMLLHVDSISTSPYIYFRTIGETNWNNITVDKSFIIPVNGTITVNIEVIITDTPMEMVCQYFVLTKTDWEDNQRGLFDVILCDGTPTTLEILDGQPMYACLYRAIAVNPVDTVEAIMYCTDGELCHNMLLTKVNDDSQEGTFNCITCSGTDIVMNILFGEPLTMCLNSAIPVNSNDTVEILGDCPEVTTTTTTVGVTDIKIQFTAVQQELIPSTECIGYDNEDYLYTFNVKNSLYENINAPINITINIHYLATYSGGSVENIYQCIILAGQHSNNILIRTRDIMDGSPGCPCPCQTDIVVNNITIATVNPLYNIVIE